MTTDPVLLAFGGLFALLGLAAAIVPVSPELYSPAEARATRAVLVVCCIALAILVAR